MVKARKPVKAKRAKPVKPPRLFETLARNVRGYRIENDLSRAQLAARAALPEGLLVEIESKGRKYGTGFAYEYTQLAAGLEVIEHLAGAMGLDPRLLLKDYTKGAR